MMRVVIGTFAWASIRIMHIIPIEDAIVIVLATGVTIAHDLALAVIVGVIVSALVYAWKQSRYLWVEEHNPEDGEPHHKVYRLRGPLFFGSVGKFKELFHPRNDEDADDIVIDFKYARVWDHSALEAIDALAIKYKDAGKTLHLVHLSPDCKLLLKNAKDMVEINTIEDPLYGIVTDYVDVVEKS